MHDINIELALWAVGILVTVGVVYGDIRARLSRVEGALGKNGSDSVFIRRTEVDLLRQAGDAAHDSMNQRMDRIQAQIVYLQDQIYKHHPETRP